MIRYLRYLFIAVLAILLITVAMANRDAVTLELFPASLGDFLGVHWALTLPLFLVVFLGIVAGLLIGFIWEWFREHRYRVDATKQKREAERLARENARLRRKGQEERDEALTMLEDNRSAG